MLGGWRTMKCALLIGERTRMEMRRQDMLDRPVIILGPVVAATEQALMGVSYGTGDQGWLLFAAVLWGGARSLYPYRAI